MSCPEILSVLKDLVLIIASLVGICVAIRGLNTWRRQLDGQADYDLSRRVLVSLFKLRDRIQNVRNPMMMAYEMPQPPEDERTRMSNEQIRFYGTRSAYESRWNSVDEVRLALYPDLLESEAIWGTELKDLFSVVFKLQHELLVHTKYYLDSINPDSDPDMRKSKAEIYKKQRDIIYDLSTNEEDDEYKLELLKAVGDIENYLKPKLKQQKL